MSSKHPDIKRSQNPQASQTSDLLGARLLRAVLGTKAFREIIKLHADEFQRSEGRALMQALLSDDPELWLGLASASPKLIDALIDSLTELGKELARMPETLVDAYLSALIRDIDTQKLSQLPAVWASLLARGLPGIINTMFQSAEGLLCSLAQIQNGNQALFVEQVLERLDIKQAAQTLNAFTRWVIAFEKDNPELISRAAQNAWPVLVQHLDSGKLRESIVVQSRLGRDLLQGLLDQILADPVTLANLVSVLPALANDGLALLAYVFENLSLPDELLASAIFNLLKQLDTTTLARVLNGLSKTVCTLHQGSAILGVTEPAFGDVFRQLVDSVGDALDSPAAQEALLAVAEDLSVAIAVISARVTAEPESLQRLLSTTSQLINLALKANIHLMRELEQIPDATWQQLSNRVNLDGTLVAQWIDLNLHSIERFAGVWADSECWSDTKDAIDWKRLCALLVRWVIPIMPDMIEAVFSAGTEQPERLAGWTNQQLQRLNHIAQTHPDSLRNLVIRFWSAIDKTELNKAWLNAGKMFARLPLAPFAGLVSKLQTFSPLGLRTRLRKHLS